MVAADPAKGLADNPVVAENRLPGTWDWGLTKPANDLELQIKGYASKPSVAQGEALDFHVSVSPPQDFRILVYRMGWYGGHGGRFMRDTGLLQGNTQPAPVFDETTGLMTTPWATDFTLIIPDHWVSGVYAAKLVNAEGFDNYVLFTVRDDERTAKLLFQRSVTTDQAYNNYPDDGNTGKSLYAFNSYGSDTLAGDSRAVKVSFDRPYARNGAGDFFGWEFQLLRWLEREGYDLSYTTNIDTHRQPLRLLDFSGFLSTGHDEYWSMEMRAALETARDQGVNLAFFGANAGYYQMRLEASTEGVADRVMVVYKEPGIDPIDDPTLKTIRWRQIPGYTEQELIGVQYTSYADTNANTDFIAINTDHWLYRDTGLTDGDPVSGIVGYEIDSFQPEFTSPTGSGYTLLSASPFLDAYGNTVISNSSIYQAPSGAWVFAAGTMSWSWALDERWGGDQQGFIDARIQKMTSNLLAAFTSDQPPDIVPRCGPSPGNDSPLDASAVDDRRVYEDGEDGDTAGWRIYAGAGSVANLLDEERDSCVIALDGNGTGTGYRLSNGDGSDWSDSERSILTLDLKYGETFALYVDVDTTHGQRYLHYTPAGLGVDWIWDIYIHHGLDSSLSNGVWQRIERDLAADLRTAGADLELLQVNGVLFRGSGVVDDIALSRPEVAPGNGRLYEDAEDGETAGWRVYSGSGRVSNLLYTEQGRVIALEGNGTATGYGLSNPDGSDWQDSEGSILSLDLNYSESFTFYVLVHTNEGRRYLQYGPTGFGDNWAWDIYIHHGLDPSFSDGRWRRIERNLVSDLRAAEPELQLLRVDGFLIRGSGHLDNIELR